MLSTLARVCFVVLATIASLFVCRPILAQEAIDSTKSSPGEAASLESFIAELNDASFRISNIRDEMVTDEQIENGQRLEAEFSEKVTALRSRSNSAARESLSLQQIDDLIRDWDRLESQFGEWSDALNNAAATISDDREWMNSLETNWNALSAAASVEERELYQERAELFFANADDVSLALRSKFRSVVDIADELALDGVVIDHSQNRLEDLKETRRRQFLTRDSAVLFLFGGDPVDSPGLIAQVQDSFQNHIDALKSFYRNSGSEIGYHFSFLAVLLLLSLYVQRKRSQLLEAREDEGDDLDLHGAAHIVSRPYSTVLLLWLAAVPFMYPYAPNLILDLSSVLSLIPITRLIPGMIPKGLIRSFYSFLIVYLLYETRHLVSISTTPGRIVLLVVTILLVVGLYQTIRKDAVVVEIGSPRGKGVLNTLLMTLLFFSGVSVLANILGYVSLSGFLSKAVFNAMYDGFLIYTALQLLEGVWVVFVRTPFARRLRAVQNHSALFVRRGVAVFRFGAAFIWISSVLLLFGLDTLITDSIRGVLTFSVAVGSLNINAGSIVAFIGFMWVAILISRFVRFVLVTDVYSRMHLGKGIADSISTLINYGILIIGFIVAFSAAGMNFESLALLVGALGVGIGFGLQTIVNNFLSGLILIFERPIKVGDMIEVVGAEGSILANVKRIGIRSSSVRTVAGAEVIVPNANLVANEVINWTKSDKTRRIDVVIGVAYGTRLQIVQDILLEVASIAEGVQQEPAPAALFTGFGDSSLDFVLRFWTDNFDNAVSVKSSVSIAVHDALMDAGIEIPFPQRDINIRSGLQPDNASPDSKQPGVDVT
jgi:potassium-dependent mechanosensitive channel